MVLLKTGGLTLKTVAQFEIKHIQYLDPEGKLVGEDLPEFAKDKTIMRQMYRDMSLVRAFDTKAYAMQRTGKMGTYPASLGQEAIGVGYGSAMTSDDVLIPYYRGTAGLLQHGVKMSEILLYWGGDERGSDYANAKFDLPIAVPIATQYLNAAGVATAMKYRGQKNAAVTEIGEGGTSKGDFYEALNVAGVWNLPILFVVNNNQWAISVSTKDQTACETYAQKAIAAGINTVQVDGNDIIACREASDQALKRARAGEGPTMIEYVSYRLCDHTTADDANRYRSKEELEEAWTKEPILRLRRYLESLNAWSDDDEEAMKKENSTKIDEAVAEFESVSKPQPESMMNHLFAELPDAYQEQLEDLRKRGTK